MVVERIPLIPILHQNVEIGSAVLEGKTLTITLDESLLAQYLTESFQYGFAGAFSLDVKPNPNRRKV